MYYKRLCRSERSTAASSSSVFAVNTAAASGTRDDLHTTTIKYISRPRVTPNGLYCIIVCIRVEFRTRWYTYVGYIMLYIIVVRDDGSYGKFSKRASLKSKSSSGRSDTLHIVYMFIIVIIFYVSIIIIVIIIDDDWPSTTTIRIPIKRSRRVICFENVDLRSQSCTYMNDKKKKNQRPTN